MLQCTRNFKAVHVLYVHALLGNQFPSTILNPVNHEMIGIPEISHLSHYVINPVLVSLDVTLKCLQCAKARMVSWIETSVSHVVCRCVDVSVICLH